MATLGKRQQEQTLSVAIPWSESCSALSCNTARLNIGCDSVTLHTAGKGALTRGFQNLLAIAEGIPYTTIRGIVEGTARYKR